MFDDFITTCPYITEIKKTLHNQNKYSNTIIFDTKYEHFLLPYQITLLLAFDQAKIFFSYHILKSGSHLDVTAWLTKNYNTLPNISPIKGNQTMKFGQLI